MSVWFSTNLWKELPLILLSCPQTNKHLRLWSQGGAAIPEGTGARQRLCTEPSCDSHD